MAGPRASISGARDVGQVGGDDARRLVDLDRRREEVRDAEVDQVRDPLGDRVLDRQRDGGLGDVAGREADDVPEARSTQRARHGHHDGAAAGAHVENPEGGRVGLARTGGDGDAGPRDGQVDEQLGLGSGDERARVDAQGEAVELLHLTDVGDRLTGLATRHERLEAGFVVGAHGRIGMGDDPRTIEPHDLAEEQLGVQARRRRAGRTEAIGRRRERLPDGRQGLQPASLKSDSRSAWSVVMSASMSRSRSPSMTAGRLWRSMPMRWSVTRSCGKL